MTDAQQAQYISQLRKVLDDLAAQFPLYVTPAYVAKRLKDEQTTLDATATAQPITQSEEFKMKRNPFNLEIVTAEMVLAAFRKDFAHVGPVSVISYDLGDGVTETYAQVHVTPQLTAVLHDDIDQIVLKANGAELFTVAWNAETEDLLHKFGAIPPHQAFAELAVHGVLK